MASFLMVLGFFLPVTGHANPEGGQVVAGGATISAPATGVVQVNQVTDKAIIEWNSFNIQANEQTHFQQPSNGSIILNRVNPSQGASEIYGQITANGQVWLVNPAGIHFGPGSAVNVGGLLASTANISNNDFMSGNYHFIQSPDWQGAITNDGRIIANHGAIAMFAPGVQNNNLILAKVGSVLLASGSEYTIDFDGDQLVQYRVDGAVMDQAVDHEGKTMKNRISNAGEVVASGGNVIMTVKTAKNILDNVINMSGIAEANTIAEHNGEIYLLGDGGTVSVSGKLVASGKQPNQTGGKVVVSGNKVVVDGQASLDASGDAGGGEILIGGDYHGDNAAVQNASTTYIGSSVAINADALSRGNGGKVIVWADDTTQFYGLISAKGGLSGGNGGFVETSGKNYLEIAGGQVNASSPSGVAGTWLLDPRNVTINLSPTTCTSAPCFSAANPTVYTPDTNNSLVLVTDILTALEGGTSVTITTGTTGNQQGNITVATPIQKTAGLTPVTLTLDSSNGGGTITINNAISSTTGLLNVVLNAGNAISIQNNISTNGGNFTASASNAITMSAGTTITTGAGSATLNANIDGAGNQNFTMNATSSILTTNGAVNINVNAASGGGGQATLGIVNTSGGALTVMTDVGGNTSGKAITQAGSSTLTAGAGNFSTGNGNVTLNKNNDFTGPVGVNILQSGNNIVINDINSMILGDIAMVNGSGNLTVTSNGSITQEAGKAITAGTGLASFNSGLAGAVITLGNDNVFYGDVALTNVGAYDVVLTNIGNLMLDDVSVGGNLSVTTTNGLIDQVGAGSNIIVAGTSSFTASGTGGAITLDNSGNQFTGAVSLTNTGAYDVAVHNSKALILGVVSVGQNLMVTTSGVGSSISQVDSVVVPGTSSFSASSNSITLNDIDNQLTGAVALSNSGAFDVSLVNSMALALAASTIGKNLSLTAGGSITQSGSVTASGGTVTLAVTAANSDILLSDYANDFGASAMVFAGTQSNIRDVGIQTSNSGALVPDFSSLTNLRHLTLNFTGAGVTFSALTLHDGGNLVVSAAGVTGGAINQTGALVVPGSSSFTTTTGAGALRSIMLTNAMNDFTGAIALTANGSGDVSIVNSQALLLDNISVGAGSFSLSGIGISQLAGTSISASGTFTLAGHTGVIDLTNAGNNFSGTVFATNTAANSVNIADAGMLNLGTIALVGASDLTLVGGGVTLTGGSTVSTGSGTIDINAGTGTFTTLADSHLFTAGNIILTADLMTIDTTGTSQIGGSSPGVGSSANVVLKAFTSGVTIGVAGGAGTLSLDQAELNRIYATNVRIGDSAAGAIVVNAGAVWTPASNFALNGVLTFVTAGSITQGGGMDFSLNQAGLILREASSVDLSSTENIINQLAAVVSGPLTVANAPTYPMTIDALTDGLGTVSGLTAVGEVTVTASGVGGWLTVNQDVTSNNNGIALSGDGITFGNNTTINAGSGLVLIEGGGGVLTLSPGVTITSTAAGDALVLAGGSFINQAGASALVASGGRFLVWTEDPANDNRGGIAYDFKQYNATYGVTTVLGSGNGFLYSIAPTVTPSLTGTVSKIYDGLTMAELLSSNFTSSPGIDGDSIALVPPFPPTANYASVNVGTGINVTVTGLLDSNISATNGSAIVYGYQLASTSAAGNVGEIIARPITVTPTTMVRYQGEPNPTVTTGFTVGGMGLVAGEVISQIGVTTNAEFNSEAGLYNLTATHVGIIFSSGLASNYNISGETLVDGLIVLKPHIPPQIINPYVDGLTPSGQALYGLVETPVEQMAALQAFVPTEDKNCENISPHVEVCLTAERSPPAPSRYAMT